MSETLLLAQHSGAFWMPEQASSVAQGVDAVFNFIFYVSLFFFVLIIGLMFFFIVRYRRRRPGEKSLGGASHNTTLEVTWSAIPVVLVCIMFWLGFKSFMVMRNAPANSYEVQVVAQKWNWLFQYPNGVESGELHAPFDTPVRLVMRSNDVIHSLFIPAFRQKRDVVPGRYSELWFRSDKPGIYPLLCAEYCGTSHSDMVTIVEVHEAGEFEKWLETADPINALTDEQYQQFIADPEAFLDSVKGDEKLSKLKPPMALGAELLKRKGCTQCHSVDGTVGTGPSLKGVYRHDVTFRDGSRIMNADENYLRESILDPGKRVVAGFSNVMPRMSLKDREIDLVIQYIKSLED